jgi:hypothetical protein
MFGLDWNTPGNSLFLLFSFILSLSSLLLYLFCLFLMFSKELFPVHHLHCFCLTIEDVLVICLCFFFYPFKHCGQFLLFLSPQYFSQVSSSLLCCWACLLCIRFSLLWVALLWGLVMFLNPLSSFLLFGGGAASLFLFLFLAFASCLIFETCSSSLSRSFCICFSYFLKALSPNLHISLGAAH